MDLEYLANFCGFLLQPSFEKYQQLCNQLEKGIKTGADLFLPYRFAPVYIWIHTSTVYCGLVRRYHKWLINFGENIKRKLDKSQGYAKLKSKHKSFLIIIKMQINDSKQAAVENFYKGFVAGFQKIYAFISIIYSFIVYSKGRGFSGASGNWLYAP